MALKTILTHKYKKEEIIELSNKIAEEREEEWVKYDEIEKHNSSILVNKGKFKKFIWYCINDNPSITMFFAILLFGISLGLINLILGFVGIIIGFFITSYLFPAKFTNCNVCMSYKKCKKIFTHVLSYDEHTENRLKDNGTEMKYKVRNEKVFIVLECDKCHGRKIEIIERQREKAL